MITSELLKMYEGDNERCGFVLKNGDVVEVPNVCMDPTEGFDMRGDDLVLYTPIAVASWHTHPGEDSNLSTGDWHSFQNWPELEHYIIGNDGVTKFIVVEGDVLIAD